MLTEICDKMPALFPGLVLILGAIVFVYWLKKKENKDE